MSFFTGGVGVLVLIAAGLTAIATIGHYIRRAWKLIAGFVSRVEKALVNVESQLYPNGGSSLRDSVDRIERHLGIAPTIAD